ncbi:MAG: hypothetical protein JRF59_00870 [Deltaproteobacteria bacterium]|nr:hypothetical protein [Deltaproteobacteria bacterium]MBW2101340.1 hypothetical protein [Deltaproteobacteria bacterium]MBW2346379.1 hypothetical protein [Deltaproteobacteria bacterium]
MNGERRHWWHFRIEDLLALGKTRAPLYIYNEETLNEIYFDLSALDVVAGLFYPFHANSHPKVLRKAFEQNTSFRCNSLLEIDRLREILPALDPGRILFLADRAPMKDCEQALKQGVHVATRPRKDTTQNSLNAIEGKGVSIYMEKGGTIVPTASSNRAARGIYICPDARFSSLCSQAEKISLFRELSRNFPNVSILTLGNDVSGKSDFYGDKWNISEIGHDLEAIQDACPRFELRLELPIHLVSYSGALVVKALESGTAEGGHYVRIHLPLNHSLIAEIHESTHHLVNLSRPGFQNDIMIQKVQPQDHSGSATMYLKHPCPVSKGDILLITQLGAYSSQTRSTEITRNRLPELYLKARSLCPVKL